MLNTESESETSKVAENAVVRSLALGATSGGGGPALVHVKGGKVVKIRPFHYNWKNTMEKLNPWRFRRNGKALLPTL